MTALHACLQPAALQLSCAQHVQTGRQLRASDSYLHIICSVRQSGVPLSGVHQGDEEPSQQERVPAHEVHTVPLHVTLVQQGSRPLLGHAGKPVHLQGTINAGAFER